MKHSFTILLLIFFVAFQLFLSFASPSYGEECWYSLEEILSKSDQSGRSLSSSDRGLASRFFSLFSNYHLHCDVGLLPLIQDFPDYYAGGQKDALIYLNRPLYPALAGLFFAAGSPFLNIPPYILAFGSAILLNFLLAVAAVLLFFRLLQKWFSQKTAFLSAVLLIFSPLFHIFLAQPIAEILAVFIVALGLYLFDDYIRSPSKFKLYSFSFLVGILMLGKMIYALPLFFLFLAIYFRRWKEGLKFFLVQFAPLGIWYLFVKLGLGLSYYSHEVAHSMGIWVFKAVNWPWPAATILINSVPNFIGAVIYGFLLIPVVLSLYGLSKAKFPHKYLSYFGFAASFFLLFLGMNYYYPRLSFMLFPLIYPTAVIGLEFLSNKIKKYNIIGSKLFYVLVFAFIILISNINIYKIINYG